MPLVSTLVSQVSNLNYLEENEVLLNSFIQIHKNLEDYLAKDFSKVLSPEEEAEKSRLLNAEQDKVRDQRTIEEKSRIRNNSKSG